MTLLFAAGAALAADCDPPSTPAGLDGTLQEALLAYVSMDEEGFLELALRAEAEAGCLRSVPTPAQAASFARVDGLRAFVQGDTDAATASFRAAHALDEGYRFPERIAPAGGKLEKLYAEAVGGSEVEDIEVADGYRAWVDGTRAGRRPTEVPAIVQIGAAEDEIGWSAVLRPGARFAPPAPYAVVDEPEAVAEYESELEVEERPEKGGGATGWWVATGVSAALAGGLFGVAALTNAQFEKSPDEGTFQLNHGTYYGSIGMAGVTLVCAGVAIGGSF